jgi:hypothetical protein
MRAQTGAQVLDAGLRFIDERTGEDLTGRSVAGSEYVLEIARIIGARAWKLSGCDEWTFLEAATCSGEKDKAEKTR